MKIDILTLKKHPVILFLIPLFIFPHNLNAQHSNAISEDRQALMDLYEATGGDNWKNNRGWGEGNPSNEWYGIKVNNVGRVVKVNLFDNNLRGELPPSIGNLTSVIYLNVKHNNLTGTLPASLGNLTSVDRKSVV